MTCFNRSSLIAVVNRSKDSFNERLTSLHWQPKRAAAGSLETGAVLVQCEEDAAALRMLERRVDHAKCLLTLLEAAAGHYAAAGQVTPRSQGRDVFQGCAGPASERVCGLEWSRAGGRGLTGLTGPD